LDKTNLAITSSKFKNFWSLDFLSPFTDQVIKKKKKEIKSIIQSLYLNIYFKNIWNIHDNIQIELRDIFFWNEWMSLKASFEIPVWGHGLDLNFQKILLTVDWLFLNFKAYVTIVSYQKLVVQMKSIHF
jgi:hypothetical protein